MSIDITLLHWRDRLYNEVLDIRSIHRIVDSRSFELAWTSASDDEKGEVLQYIEKRDNKSIKKWMKNRNQMNLSSRELREIAGQLHIRGYSKLSKEDLLTAIYQKEQSNGSDREPCDRDSSNSRQDEGNAGEVLSL